MLSLLSTAPAGPPQSSQPPRATPSGTGRHSWTTEHPQPPVNLPSSQSAYPHSPALVRAPTGGYQAYSSSWHHHHSGGGGAPSRISDVPYSPPSTVAPRGLWMTNTTAPGSATATSSTSSSPSLLSPGTPGGVTSGVGAPPSLLSAADYSPPSPRLYPSPYSPAALSPFYSVPATPPSGAAVPTSVPSPTTAPYYFPFPHHPYPQSHNSRHFLHFESSMLASMGVSGGGVGVQPPSQPTRPTPLFPGSSSSHGVPQFGLFPPPPLPPLLSSAVPPYIGSVRAVAPTIGGELRRPSSSSSGSPDACEPGHQRSTVRVAAASSPASPGAAHMQTAVSPKYFGVAPPTTTSSPYLPHGQQHRQFRLMNAAAQEGVTQKHRLVVVRPPPTAFNGHMMGLEPGEALASPRGTPPKSRLPSPLSGSSVNSSRRQSFGSPDTSPKRLRVSPVEVSRVPAPPPRKRCSPATKLPQQLRHLGHFAKGNFVRLASGDLKCVENLQAEDFVNSAELSDTIQLNSSTVVKIEENQELGIVHLGFLVGDDKLQVSADASLEHPFFVFGQGWSSCFPDRTQERYGLPCQRLQVGDVLISLTNRNGGSARKVSGRLEFTATSANAKMVSSLWRVQPGHVVASTMLQVSPFISAGAATPNQRKRRWSASDATGRSLVATTAEQRCNSLAESNLASGR